MNVAVSNAQTIRRPRIRLIRRWACYFLNRAGKRTAITWGDISILLTDNATIRKINETHLGHDYETDVISFNFDPIPGTDPALAGEIVLNVEFACEQGQKHGGCDHELALYLAHGCDHLSGEDDKTAGQRQRMRKRELTWIRDGVASGLSLKLFTP